jgi:8-oxo-dGTP pyrophosphatase MutT (NUDIX family)
MKAVILESPDWVNVVVITPEKKLVVVQQHRFGVGKTTLEIPAGIVNPGETPEQAAMRELREETGYTAARWKYLGWVEPNAAFLNNRCHQWLALDALKTGAPELDEGEEIAAAELSWAEVRSEIQKGRMRNSLSLLSLAQVFDLRSGG